MFTKPKAPTPAAKPEKMTTPKSDDKAERLRKHREAAPPDVAAAYALVAEYERRCP